MKPSELTENEMTEPKRDWKKIKYYPVSIEKLKNATMREAAYLIAPVNIGEDYEYFDEVKHLLIIPEEPKTLEQIYQEFDEKIDAQIEKFKMCSKWSREHAEEKYNRKFDRIIQDFEYAKEHGEFRPKLFFTVGDGLSVNSFIATGSSLEPSFVIKQGNKHDGYYTIGNQRYLRYYMPDKPNMIVRFFMRTCLGFWWVDEKNA